jgi:rhodanese-related sulfurtransferase
MVRLKAQRALAMGVCVAASWLTGPVQAQADAQAVEAMEAYLDFVDYQGSTIGLAQIPDDQWARYFIIDTRSADQYAQSHIPQAVNIEWRSILAKREGIPKDRPVLVYCNTGTLSSQAGLALRFAGWENVQILHGGFDGYRAKFLP